jgi:hypothetical protein
LNGVNIAPEGDAIGDNGTETSFVYGSSESGEFTLKVVNTENSSENDSIELRLDNQPPSVENLNIEPRINGDLDTLNFDVEEGPFSEIKSVSGEISGIDWTFDEEDCGGDSCSVSVSDFATDEFKQGEEYTVEIDVEDD